MKFTPEVSGIGEPQPGGWCLARRRWDGTSSRDLLMRQYLCAAERAEYQALTPRAQGPWLLSRIAIKDMVPVIILSAKGEEADKVRGFRLDADQYVTKPFGILELLERVAALLRRSARGMEGPPSTLAFGGVTVDLGSRTILRDGHAVALTPKAYELLLALVRRDGVVASRADLLKEVWGYGAFIMTRTVDSHVAELRRKLDDPTNPRHIITVWKVGYRFVR
jgi:DNA-binding response OmpR family regulator